ncbi:undecaprenyl-phosphate galactose phosphotransferase WbaP [Gallibacterium salpingitidis]|uniref:UDP-phosphate galactose phosphotransferase n=1 Tax=Gallibacterium salpingitidis TaxID=505341 RepID=A0A1A7P0L1_9PAST|nr:undecaprenyl-phosphate galactose phosphotransferase WbaP [Gallibacterium salpingitidis]OBW95286.1 UDP-phosphate galactose phosphotransferase [Gallibacterium salpingitidis]
MYRFFSHRSLIICTDFVLFLLPFFISCFFFRLSGVDMSAFIPISDFSERVTIHTFLAILCVAWFWFRLRHYTYRKPYWSELKEIIRTLLIFATFELAIIGFSKLFFSRYFFGITWLITLILFPLGRFFLKKYLIKTGVYLKDTVVIGTHQNALDAYNALMSEPYLGLRIKYFVNVNDYENETDMIKTLSVPIINAQQINILDLVENETTQFIIALEEHELEQLDLWLRFLSKSGCRSVSIIPTMRGIPLYGTDMSFLFSYEVMLLRVHNNLAKLSSRIFKRTIDIIGSILLIIISSPLLILLYLLIAKDGGHAIYGQTRIGRNKKAFKCLKFRSMVLNSQEVLQELLRNDPAAKAEWEKDFKLKNDPRITKIGKFLRTTSLDELPQLFNVLKGEMSLVGPRPIVRSELIRYKDDVDYYLMAKPGMTGLWQVSGRNNVDYKTRVYYDAWYVKNWSIWNDIVILLKTVKIVFNKTGAY